MKRSLVLLTATALAAAMSSGPAHAQLNPQTVTLMKVDPETLATGYRSSKMVGRFLGLGTKYVALPFTSLKIVDKKVVLPGHKGRSAGYSRLQIQYQQLRSSACAATLMSLGRAGAAGQLTYAPRFLGICFVLAVRPNPIFFAKTERVAA